MNSVQISGYISQCKATQGGDLDIFRFILAVNTKIRDKEGNWKKEVNFVRCTQYGPTAKYLSEHVGVGTLLAVHGRLKSKKYTKSGVPVETTEVICNDVEHFKPKLQGTSPDPALPEVARLDEDI